MPLELIEGPQLTGLPVSYCVLCEVNAELKSSPLRHTETKDSAERRDTKKSCDQPPPVFSSTHCSLHLALVSLMNVNIL
jgi:hypothetical protein